MKKRLLFFCLLIFSRSLFAQEKKFRLLPGSATGIQFINEISETENLNVLAYEYLYNGGGVAIGDINNDSLPDIFLTANMRPNKLYLNKGNFRFEDITEKTGASLSGRRNAWKTGATMADVNGDGLLDIYVCYSGKVADSLRRNQLFINQGKNKFQEMAAAYGLDDRSYSTQAAFFDMDNDGDLDMFLLNHNVKKIDNIELARYRHDIDTLAGNKLYRNDGHRFTEVTLDAGIRQSPLSFGLGIAISDINQDGWQDIYVSNDYNEQDYCYLNQKNGTFTEVSKNCFRYQSQFSMGVDIADFNNDALPDVITLDMLPDDNRRQKLLQLQENYESFQLMTDQGLHRQYMRNMLHLNNGNGTFSEIGQLAGVARTDWSWSPLLADLDNDGYKDLFVTNGYLRDYTNKDFLRYWGDYKVRKAVDREPVMLMDLVKAMPVTRYANYVFQNSGELQFQNRQQEWGMDQSSLSNGAAYADLDNDGDLDIVINNINEQAFVYENRSRQLEPSKSHFIQIQLQEPAGNRLAIGAKGYLYANGQVQYQELNPSRGYLSAMQPVLHFGLGSTSVIDSLRVEWPGGETVVYRDLKIDQRYFFQNTQKSNPASRVRAVFTKPVFTSPAAAPLKYEQHPKGINDFKRQLLMPFMYSHTGTVMAAGDIDHDGLEDVFVGGDEESPGQFYLQNKNGNFSAMSSFSWNLEGRGTPGAAGIYDINGDGHADLYLAKGGYDLTEPGQPALQDECWLGDGRGNFKQLPLPDVSASSKSCVRMADIDGDGDIDIFVGGRIIPGQYPVTPRSYLLINEGNRSFSTRPGAYDSAGLVTDAQWFDCNKDGRPDLIVCGEMMPVRAYINEPGGFVEQTEKYFPSSPAGFWNTIQPADVNGDGKVDFIAGNLGLNSPMRASKTQPVELFYADFDENGSIDPFLNFYMQGTSYPFVSRDELNDQIYSMRRRFVSYRDYSNAKFADIFTTEERGLAKQRTATELRSMVFLNTGDHFELKPLPVHAQFSVVTQVVAGDMDGDGKTDLVLFGNRSDNRLKIGSIDAGYGCLLKGNGKGDFSYIPAAQSGLNVTGDVKSVLTLQRANQNTLIIGRKEGSLLFYTFQK